MAVDNGDIIKAVFELELDDGTKAQHAYHFKAVFTAQQTNSAVRAAVKQYVEDIYTPLLGSVVNTVTVNPTEVDKIAWDPTEGIWKVSEQIGSTLPSLTFTNGGDQAPNQVAPLIRANTSRPKTYGKKFLIGFGEASMAGSDLTGAVLTALATTLAHYLADETVAGADVLSPGVPRKGVNAFEEFTDGVVNSVVGTQRRRAPGIGS